jgi:DNA-binding IclR family transcriptional regulator
MSKIVERTLACFEIFAEQRAPLSLTELAKHLKIPMSSCRDVVQALQRRGYLYETAPRSGFYPTQRLYALTRTTAANDPVLQRSDGVLRALRDELDETIMLARAMLPPTGLQAVYLQIHESSQSLRVVVGIGDRLRSLHATSAGKALLASLDPRALNDYLRTATLTPFTTRCVATKEALRAQLDVGRKLGYFVNLGESIEGLATISASFDWQGSVYLVTVGGPEQRIIPKQERTAAALLDACRRLAMRGAEAAAPAGSTGSPP